MQLEMTDTILAIDPTSRGFAFAVLEASAFLVDWGERIIPAKTGGLLLRKVDELLSRYKPTLLVIEDLAVPDAGSEQARRSTRSNSWPSSEGWRRNRSPDLGS